MLWFPADKRKKLLKLLSQFLKDQTELSDIVEKWLKSPSEINTVDINEQREQIRKMIIEDAGIIQLLFELRKQGTLVFNDSNTGEEIVAILKELLDLAKKEEFVFIDMLKNYTIPWDTPRSFLIYKNKLKVLTDSIHRNIDELEADMRNGMRISEKIVFTIQEKDIKIEMHKNPAFISYLGTDQSFDKVTYCKYGLLIFNHDFLVAEVRIADYAQKNILSERMITYVRGLGYPRRAIKILLQTGAIQTWISDTSLTDDAKKMFESLREDDYLDVSLKNKRFEVNLKKKK